MQSDTVVMTLLVRNELDIIRENIDFHLSQGMDHIIVTDNNSVDGTRDILSDYEKAGAITVLDEPGNDHSQWEWVTSMTHLAKDKFNARWVINNDADEFWVPEKGNLKTSILEQTDKDLLKCIRLNMISAYDVDEDQVWYDKLLYRVSKPLPIPKFDFDSWMNDDFPAPFYYFSLLGKAIVNTEHVKSIKQGNHNAIFSHTPREAKPNITVYHFPIRSQQHHIQKVRQAGAAYARNNKLPQSVGIHQRRWYKMLMNGQVARMLADALPSRGQLNADIEQGIVIKDTTLQSCFQELKMSS